MHVTSRDYDTSYSNHVTEESTRQAILELRLEPASSILFQCLCHTPLELDKCQFVFLWYMRLFCLVLFTYFFEARSYS